MQIEDKEWIAGRFPSAAYRCLSFIIVFIYCYWLCSTCLSYAKVAKKEHPLYVLLRGHFSFPFLASQSHDEAPSINLQALSVFRSFSLVGYALFYCIFEIVG